MTSRASLFVLAGLASCGPSAMEESDPTARVPRVVLVTLDTLHVDFTSPYNPEVSTTPFLERMASEGVRFENAYTLVPVTLPSHAALMTGVDPRRLGVLRNGDEVPGEAQTLAESLAARGYRTAAFISLGVLGRDFGLAQGFSTFHDPFDAESTRWYRTADEVFAPVADWVRENREHPFFLWVHFSDPHEPYLPVDSPPDAELHLDDELVDRFRLVSAEKYHRVISLPPGEHRLRFTSLREPRPDDRPETAITLRLFPSESLALHASEPLPDAPDGEAPVPLGPHHDVWLENPGRDPVEVEVVFAGGLERPTPSDVLPSYETEVAYMDRFLSELDALLASTGEVGETLFVVVSDHGEGLFRHDILGHAEDVYEDQLRIVWILRGPGVPAGRVLSESPALAIDVAPTILDLLDLYPSGMEGRSWADCLRGGSCPANEPFWAFAVDHRSRRPEAMAGYRWPYKWMWQRSYPRSGYELSTDPREEQDLLEHGGPHNPEPLKRLAESFPAERRKMVEALSRSRARPESKQTEELLRSLGYVGGSPRRR